MARSLIHTGVWLYQVVYTWTCFEYDSIVGRKCIQHFMWNPLFILAVDNQ